MSRTNTFMNEERLYSILTKVIDKLTNQVGIPEEEILDMFEISENEIKELSMKNRRLN